MAEEDVYIHKFSPYMYFPEEVLKDQDGKTVPLTLGTGGPVIGEATLHYNPDTKNLEARCTLRKSANL